LGVATTTLGSAFFSDATANISPQKFYQVRSL
jgi:hypothetical protein